MFNLPPRAQHKDKVECDLSRAATWFRPRVPAKATQYSRIIPVLFPYYSRSAPFSWTGFHLGSINTNKGHF